MGRTGANDLRDASTKMGTLKKTSVCWLSGYRKASSEGLTHSHTSTSIGEAQQGCTFTRRLTSVTDERSSPREDDTPTDGNQSERVHQGALRKGCRAARSHVHARHADKHGHTHLWVT